MRRAAELALPHRLRSRPFEDAPDPEEIIEDHFENEADEGGRDDEGSDEGETGDDDNGSEADKNEAGQTETTDDERRESGDPENAPSRDDGSRGRDEPAAGQSDADGAGDSAPTDDGNHSDNEDADEATPLIPGQTAEIGEAAAPTIEFESSGSDESTGGSHRSAATMGEGPRVRTERAGPDDAIDAAASIRAATTRGATTVESRDLRRSVCAGSASALVVFALDASASMYGPMRAAKGVVMDLLEGAYEARDEVSVVAFAGEESEVLLPPTDSVSMAARHLKELPTADRTPLAAGLQTAGEVLSRADPAVGVVVLITDGRANAGGDSPTAATRRAARGLAELNAHVVVVDAGDPEDRTTLTTEIVRVTDGERVPLSALSAERVEDAVADAHHRP